MINIAVLGYGTVGSGVVEVINTNSESINKRAGQEINIKYVLDKAHELMDFTDFYDLLEKYETLNINDLVYTNGGFVKILSIEKNLTDTTLLFHIREISFLLLMFLMIQQSVTTQ